MLKIFAIIIVCGIQYYIFPHTPKFKIINKLRCNKWLDCYKNILTKVTLNNQYLESIVLLLPVLLAVLFLTKFFYLIFGLGGLAIFCVIALFFSMHNLRQDQNEIQETSEIILEHEKVYAILFWFAVLGPVGCVAYWFLSNSKIFNLELLGKIHNVAAWIPARITGLILSLVGNFDNIFSKWIMCVKDYKMHSFDVLAKCEEYAGQDLKLMRVLVCWLIFCCVYILT